MGVISQVSLGDNIYMFVVDANPAQTPVDAPRGSLIMWAEYAPVPTFKPVLFYKLDDGLTTNVETITKRDNYTATVNPGPADTSFVGYSVGSKWYNTTTGKLFELCAIGPAPGLLPTWVQLN